MWSKFHTVKYTGVRKLIWLTVLSMLHKKLRCSDLNVLPFLAWLKFSIYGFWYYMCYCMLVLQIYIQAGTSICQWIIYLEPDVPIQSISLSWPKLSTACSHIWWHGKGWICHLILICAFVAFFLLLDYDNDHLLSPG